MRKTFEDARRHEPVITGDVVAAAERAGLRLEGLENRLKSWDSLETKVRRDAETKGISERRAAEAVFDALRYTAVGEPGLLVAACRAMLEDLGRLGYTVIRVKNTWLDDFNPYRGINVVMCSPAGQKFELQFHTPQSFEAKSGEMHRIYEEYRAIGDAASAKALQLRREMFRLSATLTKPADIEVIQ